MRKTFSITNKQVLDKLDTMDNQSKYIEELVLKDIHDKYGGIEFERAIYDTIDSILLEIDSIKKALGDKKRMDEK